MDEALIANGAPDVPAHVVFRELRRPASPLLIVGCASGLLGFMFAGSLGLVRQFFGGVGGVSIATDINLRGEHFKSGMAYWPDSVSELVFDPATPCGEVWLAFETIASLCILMSWYPWRMQNVYVGCGVTFCGMNFLHMRSIIPPLGLLIVVNCHLADPGCTSFNCSIASLLHLVGAFMLFGGQSFFEGYTLIFSNIVKMKPFERKLRWVCNVLGTFLFLNVIFWSMIEGLSGMVFCCGDDWQVPTEDDVSFAKSNGHEFIAAEAERAMAEGTHMLMNTASGFPLLCKYMAFICEVCSGVILLMGLIVVWWYNPDRTRNKAYTSAIDDAFMHVVD